MKAFTFRLEQVLRWREAEVSIQKSRVGIAVSRVAESEASLDALQAALSNASARIVDHPTGVALESYSGFREKSRSRILDCAAEALAAQRTLTLETNALIKASQRLRLLENLKRTDLGLWRREFDREVVAFADEAFLNRMKYRARGQTTKTPIETDRVTLRLGL